VLVAGSEEVGEQGFARGEVPVEGAGADAGLLGDRIERAGHAVLGERALRDPQDVVPVPQRVSARGA
jgi:hypothetical protein